MVPRTIALQRFVLFPRDSLTRLPREQAQYTKIPADRTYEAAKTGGCPLRMDMIWQGAGPFRKTSLPLRKTEAAPLVKRAGPFQETSRLVLAVGDARSADAAAFQTVSLPSRIRRSVASVFGQNRA